MSWGFTCFSYEKSDFLIPCPKLRRLAEISIVAFCIVNLFLHLLPVVIFDNLL